MILTDSVGIQSVRIGTSSRRVEKGYLEGEEVGQRVYEAGILVLRDPLDASMGFCYSNFSTLYLCFMYFSVCVF